MQPCIGPMVGRNRRTVGREGFMDLNAPPDLAAPSLLGDLLVRDGVMVRITEVEAYGGPEDSASHARHGLTARNASMWGHAGQAYLYFCYGMHWMLNVVTGPEGKASAVLIRGAEVVGGLETILLRRRASKVTPSLCAGPGKVAQALGVDLAYTGHLLYEPGGLELRTGAPPEGILCGPRVGIDFAAPEDRARPWRFAAAGTAWVSQRKPLG